MNRKETLAYQKALLVQLKEVRDTKGSKERQQKYGWAQCTLEKLNEIKRNCPDDKKCFVAIDFNDGKEFNITRAFTEDEIDTLVDTQNVVEQFNQCFNSISKIIRDRKIDSSDVKFNFPMFFFCSVDDTIELLKEHIAYLESEHLIMGYSKSEIEHQDAIYDYMLDKVSKKILPCALVYGGLTAFDNFYGKNDDFANELNQDVNRIVPCGIVNIAEFNESIRALGIYYQIKTGNYKTTGYFPDGHNGYYRSVRPITPEEIVFDTLYSGFAYCEPSFDFCSVVLNDKNKRL